MIGHGGSDGMTYSEEMELHGLVQYEMGWDDIEMTGHEMV